MIKLFVLFTFCTLCYSHIYVWSKFHNEKINFKNYRLYLCFVIMVTVGLITYFKANAYIRMIIDISLFCVCNYFIFKKMLNETLVSTIYSALILSISDVITAVIVMLFFEINSNSISGDIFLSACGNLLTAIVFILICNLKIVKKIYYKLIGFTNIINPKILITIFMLVMISINFLMATIYYKLNAILIGLINSILLLTYSYITYRSINEKNNSLIIKAENESLMESLNEYENMVDRQRVDNHENKNQLLIIKNMIKKKDSSVVKYIDTIVKDEKEDDEILYTRVKNIPTGGLQGIIYQKMLTMKDNRILFSLSVSRDVRSINLENLSMSDNYKLCKIVGVLLDNAIEASLTCEDKRIMISLYVDEKEFIIEISNRYKENIDLNNIDKEGYTTKGDGHGYGLSLVKEIVSNSKIFINERKVTKDIFKQTIKIDLKNI